MNKSRWYIGSAEGSRALLWLVDAVALGVVWPSRRSILQQQVVIVFATKTTFSCVGRSSAGTCWCGESKKRNQTHPRLLRNSLQTLCLLLSLSFLQTQEILKQVERTEREEHVCSKVKSVTSCLMTFKLNMFFTKSERFWSIISYFNPSSRSSDFNPTQRVCLLLHFLIVFISL